MRRVKQPEYVDIVVRIDVGEAESWMQEAAAADMTVPEWIESTCHSACMASAFEKLKAALPALKRRTAKKGRKP